MTKKINRQDHQDKIQQALDYLETHDTTIGKVAKMFDLPKTTFRRAVNNGVPKRPGPPTILTEEEEQELTGYCLNLQKLGFGLTRSAVNYTVMQIIQLDGRNHPFADGGPGQAWWMRFLLDHPELSFRVPQALTQARAQKANPAVIDNHFNKLNDTIKLYSLTADRIYNMDETGFNITARLGKVLAKKNAREVHKIANGNSNDHISVCTTISASGAYIPPLIIYKGSRVVANLLKGAPAGSAMAFTENGYMVIDIFRQFIEHFIKSIPPARPVLLMMDGHGSHIDLKSIEQCQKNKIILYALPSNTTHILQPAEIPFKKLKTEYDITCDEYRNTNGGALVTKHTFAFILGKAYIKTYTPLAITNAFMATGIWPFNPDVI